MDSYLSKISFRIKTNLQLKKTKNYDCFVCKFTYFAT